jgi:signal peptide peptidase SppA
MKYPHLYTKFFNAPLALHKPVIEAFNHYLVNGEPLTKIEGRQIGESISVVQIRDVAVVKLEGVIDKGMSEMDAMCYGGIDLNRLDSELANIAGNPQINRVVLAINSPGGGVIGVPETAKRIAALRQTKEVHAYVDVMACSAGYWLASQADVITATPSAIVGSIGVYTVALDLSAAYEADGINVQLIKAGKHKDRGSNHRPLTNEERADIQASVDEIHAGFKSACTDLRSISEDDMEGQTFTGAEAEEKGLVDILTNFSLDEYVSELLLSEI